MSLLTTWKLGLAAIRQRNITLWTTPCTCGCGNYPVAYKNRVYWLTPNAYHKLVRLIETAKAQ